MTPTQRQQLELLVAEQRRLSAAVLELGSRVETLAAELKDLPPAQPHSEPPPLPIAPSPAATPAPPIQPIEEVLHEARLPAPPLSPEVPPPLPAHAFASAAEPPEVAASERSPEPESLEMQIGTVWLARIGIVILVTGLVFLGNYARQFIVAHLGPAGKVAVLYTAAALLGGIGVCLERRAEATRRFAQVLIAGGAATAYYATYAAHFVPRLRVIESPLVGGLALLAAAALFIWWSDRRRRQTAAILAIGLSYYTSAINPIGTFTLYSSLVLTAAAGFLLLRNGWALVSWVSLAGTYLSFAFWRFHHLVVSGSFPPLEPWSVEVFLLGGYWLLFTAPVFYARARDFPPIRRTAFLTLNNALFVCLATERLARTNHDVVWEFLILFGLALLMLAALARWRRSEEHELDGAYLVQGLTAVTAGLAIKLSGPSLAVTLAMESVILLTAANRRHGLIFQFAGFSLAGWAFGIAIWEVGPGAHPPLPLGMGISALLLLAAWWLKQRLGTLAAMQWSSRAAYLALLAVILLGFTFIRRFDDPWDSTALAIGAVFAAASIYGLRLPEFSLLGQSLLAAAVVRWLPLHFISPDYPWWHPLPIAACALALAHWWLDQKPIQTGRLLRGSLHAGSASALVLVGFFWMRGFITGADWIVLTALTGLAAVAYSWATRAWAIALFAQLFTLASITSLLIPWAPKFDGWIECVPVLCSFGTTFLLAAARRDRWPESIRPLLRAIALGFWLLSTVLTVAWAFAHIAHEWQMIFFALIGSALTLSTAGRPSRVATGTGLAYLALAYFLFVTNFVIPPRWQELVAILLAPGTLRLARKLSPASDAARPEFLIFSAAGATAGVWLWITRWMFAHGHSEALTLAWSGLAVLVFVTGLSLGDRIYRRGGLVILALAVGRIIFADVWRLDTIYRIISLLVLGVVLLSLSYIYNRYSDQIKRWL